MEHSALETDERKILMNKGKASLFIAHVIHYGRGSQFQSSHPRSACLFTTPDSDNQLVRSALRAWTVFRLTCSLHRVHCSLHRVHCSLHRVHCSLHRVHCSLHRVHCSLHRVHCSLHRVHCSQAGEICWSLLYFGTFIYGFALRNVFTHRRVWHHIPLYIYTILIHVLHTSMHFEWNIYIRFELESWRNILWCPLRRALAFE